MGRYISCGYKLKLQGVNVKKRGKISFSFTQKVEEKKIYVFYIHIHHIYSHIYGYLCALNMPANLENSAVATGLEKVSSFQSQRKAMAKNAQTTAQLHSSHMLVK